MEAYCKIEHHATIFALLAKYAIELCGEEAYEVIQKGMIRYGRERGRRMAVNAISNGDELNAMANQIYGEWTTDFEGQMEFGYLQSEPSLRTYVSKCAWCDAWNKHGLLEYGKLYCENVDAAVYQGFSEDFVCTPLTKSLSNGGEQCQFDWQFPVEDMEDMQRRKEAAGLSFVKNFNFHTAHLLKTVGDTIKDSLAENGEVAVKKAIEEYIRIFGQPYYEVLDLDQKF